MNISKHNEGSTLTMEISGRLDSTTAPELEKEIGIKILVLGSSGSRSIPEGFDRAEAEEQFTGFLKKIAPAAEKYGVIVAIEPLQTQETNFINTVKEGAEIARKTGAEIQ